MKKPRWKLAYYASLAMFAAGLLLLLCARGTTLSAVGGALLVGGGLVRFLFCRCPYCGAAIMRLRRGNVCPSCLAELEDEKKKD